ncbi:MAG: HupE/UreJ family protein [Rickettsiales bacterium]|nr:HupE/UreJ family protein [Rickettsiales bacterium]
MPYLLSLLLFLPTLAHAHTMTEAGGGFEAGLFHPVLGLDHLLAMVSVGLLSSQIGGKAIFTVPASFVLVMACGGWLGMEGTALPLVEYGIALSVIVLGLAIALGRKLPVFFAMVCVAFFAVFHGHAHGMEMPELAEPVKYALGFLTGTIALHIVGVMIGYMANKTRGGPVLVRYLGAFVAGMGFHILLLGLGV